MAASKFELITRLFARGDNQPRRTRGAGRRPNGSLRQMETLEPRAMLAATVDDSGLLTIVGTERRDVIEVRAGATLGSGFPRQRTACLLDWLLLPLIHFILLGFLPLGRSRQDKSPGLAAGCGQWFVTRRDAYAASGGHAAIRASLHDGIMLPRAYRRAGLATDIFDASDIVSCRMYSRSIDVWRGLAKNATEGIGAPATILPFTLLLAAGQILPFVLGAVGLASGWPAWTIAVAGLACGLAVLPRIAEAVRFRQSLSSAAAQPLAIAVFLAIQWYALVRKVLGLKTAWRGRSLAPQ